MYKWVKATNNEGIRLLIDTVDCNILAFVQEYGGRWKCRKLDVQDHYTCDENELVHNPYWSRTTIDINQSTMVEAQERVNRYFNIFDVAGLNDIIERNDPREIVQFLAKLQNVELFGKIELVVRIEGYEPPKAKKAKVKKDD